jgi:PAS domain S-box-containing protein
MALDSSNPVAPEARAEPLTLRTTIAWQFLITLYDRLRPLRNPLEIQEVATRLLGEHLHVNRVSYAEIDGDEFVVTQSYAKDVAPFVGRGSIAALGAALLEPWRRGETIVVDDVRTDPRFTDAERARLLEREIAAFVSAMLHQEGRRIAAFCVHSSTPRVWTADDIALIVGTCERAWAAAERARAQEAMRKSEERHAFLLKLSDAIRPLGDPAKILAEACRLLGTHLGVNRVRYGEIDGDECTVLDDYVDGVVSLTGRFRWTQFAGGLADEILRGGVLVVNDTATDPRTVAERDALKAADIGAYLLPVLIKDGRFVAAIGIHSRTPRVWTQDEITLVHSVADRIWATLEQLKAEAAWRANEERLAFLLRLNDALRPLNDPLDVQEAAARLLGEHLRVNRVGYAEVKDREYIIHREYSSGVQPLVGHGPAGSFGAALQEAYKRGETVVVTDVSTDSRFTEPERETMRARQIDAFVGVTLIKGGRLVAAFGANNATPRVWTPTEIELIRDVAERTWDAVERARAEGALREREHRVRLALDASAAGSWTWDARTNHIDWDDGFRLRYGFTPEEPPTFEAWLGRVHEEDRPQVLGLLDEILRTPAKDAWDNSFRIVRPDGTVSWIQSLGRADRDVSGQVTRLTGLELDITERRKGEETLRARRDEEHDRELRLLLETAAQGIVSVDAQGRIVTANHALESMFGWAPGELIGQSIDRLVPSSLRDLHARHWGKYFKAPRPRPMGGGDLELLGERKDGATFPIEVSLNHIATSSGGRAIAFVTDITERQRAAAALIERTDELEYRTAQLSQLASDLTLAEQHAREQLAKTLHDGLQQLLLIAVINLDQQVKRDVQQGRDSAELLLLAKSHLDEAITAARSLSFELFPPVLQTSGLPAALAWLGDWARDKYRVDVRVTADPLANSARKDVRTLLFESVRELILNAVKHAKVEEVEVNLALDPDDMLSVTVTDQGAGFDPAGFVDRAKTGHAGLGLFSIRERLTLLGGRFDIDSAPGRGTRFHLIAPRGATQDVATAQKSSMDSAMGQASRGASASPSTRALRILIVDDHAAVRKAFHELLQERPELQVVGDAADGVEAIAQAHELRPDVVMMDVSMPRMDGVEATRRIRAELPSIQVLGVSMQPRTQGTHAIEQAGAVGFFVKGADMSRLIDRLLVMHGAIGPGSPDEPRVAH